MAYKPKPGAWQLQTEDGELIDKYSRKCKSVIVDKDTNKRYVCSNKYVLFDKEPELFENTHNIEVEPRKFEGKKVSNTSDKMILNDIWINSL